LLALLAEAEEFFAPPGNETGAGHFFNTLAQLADRPNLSPLRDDLRDRALRGLAGKLRPHAHLDRRPGTTVSALLGQSGVWKAALVSDADFAFKAALKKKEKAPPISRTDDRVVRFRVHTGVVSAVCVAPDSGRVFLGFVNGDLAGFDPQRNLSITSFGEVARGPVVSLATDERGTWLIALSKDSPQTTALVSLGWSGTAFRNHKRQPAVSTGPTWLTPIAEHEGHAVVGLWKGDHLAVLWYDDLVPWGRREVGQIGAAARAALLFLGYDSSPGVAAARTSGCLFCGDIAWCFASLDQDEGNVLHFGWRPCGQLHGLCSPPPLSRLWRDRQHLEIAGVDEDDSIHWTEMDYSHPERPALGGGASNAEWKYVATCLLRPGLLAAVTREGIVWLRRHRHQLQSEGMMPVALENAVACAVSLPTWELLVICREGVVVRVPLPN
jgi:hypothetical protein